MKKIKFLIAGIVLVVAIVIGIAQTGLLTLSDEKYIDIGILLPLSGDASIYGQEMKLVFDYTIDEINKEGGINGKKNKTHL